MANSNRDQQVGRDEISKAFDRNHLKLLLPQTLIVYRTFVYRVRVAQTGAFKLD